mmetsp:Transcript_46512/g.108419  ORF Transcript_46512/g.108419 Transcript_46512/m.108419 type:complete len:186 (-) Transcript_46512:207-764(-)
MASADIADAEGYQDVSLYGGAIRAQLPKTFLDGSELRQVPDNQELWLDAASDLSVIIEILEYESKADEADPLPFFLKDLVESDEAALVETWATTAVTPAEGVPASSLCYQGGGVQRASKFNETTTHEVHVHLGLIRLKDVESDILIQYLDPIAATSGEGRGREVVSQILDTLTIKEMSLFSPSSE